MAEQRTFNPFLSKLQRTCASSTWLSSILTGVLQVLARTLPAESQIAVLIRSAKSAASPLPRFASGPNHRSDEALRPIANPSRPEPSLAQHLFAALFVPKYGETDDSWRYPLRCVSSVGERRPGH